MMIAAVVPDLLLYSRIDAAAAEAGTPVLHADDPLALVDRSDLSVVIVDWSSRRPGWAEALIRLRAGGARIVLVGPHTDLEAHRAAREAGLGPMLARSRLMGELPALVR